MRLKFKCITLAGQEGMSLIEIIIVIALMGTLMTIVVSNITDRQQEAMEEASVLGMKQLQKSLELYRIHNYRYPSSDQGLGALLAPPDGARRWRGPYTDQNKLEDPWGNPFLYESDGKKWQLSSIGPDEEPQTDDDIYYPETGGARGSC